MKYIVKCKAKPMYWAIVLCLVVLILLVVALAVYHAPRPAVHLASEQSVVFYPVPPELPQGQN